MVALLRMICLVLALAPAECLVVGTASSALTKPAVGMRASFARMGEQEDKEFEEWRAKKMAAAGVDPNEDFATGRAVESSIYLVGGIITVVVPLVAGLWAYNEGYLTPQ